MKSIVSLGSRLFPLLFAALTVSTAMAGQLNYAALYVFGDSLSDTGNDLALTAAYNIVPAIPPSVTPYATYWKGRFSNGPVAVEYLWKLASGKNSAELTPSVVLGITPTAVTGSLSKNSSVNFAYGGSGSGIQNSPPNGPAVPGLVKQVEMYKKAFEQKSFKPNALYVVWSGSNDYLQGITYDPKVVVDNITNSIQALYDTGARDFLVPNLADLGGTPLIKAQGQSTQFTLLTKSHNASLAYALGSLDKLPGIKIVRLDVFTLGKTMVDSGLVNADVPALAFLAPGTPAMDCLFINPAMCIDVPQANFLAPFMYWDVLHPTTQMHSIIGTAMYFALLK